jgi:ATP-dependent Lon protease
VKTIDEGIEILTGKPGGELQADGAYPEGTINYLVNEKLKSLAEGLKKFGEEEEAAAAPEDKGKGKSRKGKK